MAPSSRDLDSAPGNLHGPLTGARLAWPACSSTTSSHSSSQRSSSPPLSSSSRGSSAHERRRDRRPRGRRRPVRLPPDSAAAPRSGSDMTVAGWFRDRALPRGPHRADAPNRRLHGARVHRRDQHAGFVERPVYRLLGVRRERGQDWKGYARSVLVFSALSFPLLYLVLRTQGLHPFNPQDLSSPTWDVSFNTAASFTSNTNWQSYAERRSPTSPRWWPGGAQLGIGRRRIAVAVAVIRGLSRARRRARQLLGRHTRARFTCSSRSPSSGPRLPRPGRSAELRPLHGGDHTGGRKQTIAQGPVASQEIIKLLGTNGGGFFNANSAHPFENPIAWLQLCRVVIDLSIPAALTHTLR